MQDPDNYPLLVIVDDEQEIIGAIKRCLMRLDVKIEAFTSPRLALEFLKSHEPKMVISDQRMPDISGVELLTQVKELWPNAQRIMLSAFQEFDLVLHGFNEKIIDKFISKPWKNTELQYVVTDINQATSQQSNAEQRPQSFIGEHPFMLTLFSNIQKAAGANVPIFIHGETGTGKELVASACHELGCKRAGEFIAINCANFSEQLIESQLFGHKKGAFTGAVSDQKGIFESANGGTVFLDEITTLPLSLQSKLLRVIQERVYSPLGSLDSKHFDSQIVSASSTSLSEAVSAGTFRQDLYYRLGVIPLKIPPLKSRGDDIMLLAKHFLNRFSQQYSKHFKTFSNAATTFINCYAWPGNVRQLENVIHGVCVLNDAKEVDKEMLLHLIEDIPIQVDMAVSEVTDKPEHADLDSCETDQSKIMIEPLELVEKKAIEQALAHCDGNVNKAASLLDVNPSTLYRKIKQWQ